MGASLARGGVKGWRQLREKRTPAMYCTVARQTVSLPPEPPTAATCSGNDPSEAPAAGTTAAHEAGKPHPPIDSKARGVSTHEPTSTAPLAGVSDGEGGASTVEYVEFAALVELTPALLFSASFR